MRRLLPLFVLGSSALAQDKAPKLYPPDAAAVAKIKARTAELWALVEKLDSPYKADVAVYAKAAEWTVKLEEYYDAKSAEKLNQVLDSGFKRAGELKTLKDGEPSWMKIRGRPVIRGYKSYIDGSYQPYSVTVPPGLDVYGEKWRMDTVLHGRDGTLTETKFIAARETAKPGKPLPYVVLEPYGRGNLAYRWAAESELVVELGDALFPALGEGKRWKFPEDRVLRGFSMGGAGAWHVGLHYPTDYRAVAPGAGFTTTRGYIKLPEKLPDYVEKCLHIYDAVVYAENAFNVPVVAYSGEKDGQKKAADNVFEALAKLPVKVDAVHLVAPALEHKQPPEWYAKIDSEIDSRLKQAGDPDSRHEKVRFVTYTAKYHTAAWVWLDKLGESYQRARVEAEWNGGAPIVATENVVRFVILGKGGPIRSLTVDGQKVEIGGDRYTGTFEKKEGTWKLVSPGLAEGPEKSRRGCTGPIDEAFTAPFAVFGPTKPGWFRAADGYAAVMVPQFAKEWERYFRGALPTGEGSAAKYRGSVVLFGDPASNPDIAAALPKLPITWTKEKLVVNGKTYDPQTHLPALCYPNVFQDKFTASYTVLNSGHTFREADLKASNANLYPRLGDWAVIKPTPTKAEPWKYEVVDAGLFDENWQFKK